LKAFVLKFSIFQSASFPTGNYKLSAFGLNGLKFSGEKFLSYLAKHFSLFIQTDKAIYKANDIIRFRLFAINPQSFPYNVKGVPLITITDPSDNKIKQYTNITFVKGKYQNELLLSSSPKVGTWKIEVEAESEVTFLIFIYFQFILLFPL
jgi:CD109 antigen